MAEPTLMMGLLGAGWGFGAKQHLPVRLAQSVRATATRMSTTRTTTTTIIIVVDPEPSATYFSSSPVSSSVHQCGGRDYEFWITALQK